MKLSIAPFALASLLFPMAALAQTGSIPDNATLQSLLAEVRQLRLAVERATSVLPQTQLLLQRAQLQQQHVESVSRQLEQLRDEMAKSAAEDARNAGHVKALEALAGQEQDPNRRQQFEDEIKGLKAHLEQQGTLDQEQKARESQLAAQLQNEQAKLSELNERLDALERTFQYPAPAR